jgi:hypothetical protein
MSISVGHLLRHRLQNMVTDSFRLQIVSKRFTVCSFGFPFSPDMPVDEVLEK